tara:strand:- start:580 stop:1182 length:603 start_codon:yes stop_codon:yes gene_type:complete
MFTSIVFYLFASLLTLSGTMTILSRNPVHSALFLVLAFFSSAGLWLLLEAEFLAIALVLVYVGAVMVLFLFVVMMLDINTTKLREGFARYFPIAVFVAVILLYTLLQVVGRSNFGLESVPVPEAKGPSYSNTEALGVSLFTEFLLPFEIAALILLVAIVSAIALTLRPSRQTKAPKVEEQIAVRRADRIRIVQVDAERDS